MIGHEELRDMIGARNYLDPEEIVQLDAHMQDCHACRLLAEEYAHQDIFLQSLRLPEPAPQLRHGIFRRIDRRKASGGRARLPAISLVPVLALVLAGSALLVHGGSSQHTAQGPGSRRFGSQSNGAASQGIGRLRMSPSAAPAGVDSASQQRASSKTHTSITGPVFIHTFTGSGRSQWLRLSGGIYKIDERNRPPGCVTSLVLVARNDYHVVQINPNYVRHVPHFHKGSTAWTWYSAHLVAGWYGIEGSAAVGCRWSARIGR
jgi:hypothetical protein